MGLFGNKKPSDQQIYEDVASLVQKFKGIHKLTKNDSGNVFKIIVTKEDPVNYYNKKKYAYNPD